MEIIRGSEVLLSLTSEKLEVSATDKGIVMVCYKGAEIKDGMFLKSVYGCGRDFEEACGDYLKLIRGKTLVFDACTKNRREVTVLG